MGLPTGFFLLVMISTNYRVDCVKLDLLKNRLSKARFGINTTGYFLDLV